MNNDRRKAIRAIQDDLLSAIRNAIDEAVRATEEIRDAEQEAFDNLPESFQNGEKGEAAQAAIDALENAISDLEGLDVESIDSNLEEAVA